jgi:hypothetical protein
MSEVQDNLISEVTPGQLGNILSGAIENNFPVMIVGAPGVGKSDIMAQACAKAKARLEIMHPVVSSPIDYKGLPYVGDGETAKYLPDTQLNKLIMADKPTVCFMDDLGQAPAAVQAACMQLILARRVNGHRISDHVTFMAATNRREDHAGVNGILEPVKSRFKAILHLVPDVNDWCKWAIKANMPIELVAFIRYRPEKLIEGKPSRDMVNSPCPRTVTSLGQWFQAGVEDIAVWSGAVGQGFATEFHNFIQIWKKLPRFSQIVADPENAQLPESDELSVAYATIGMLVKNVRHENVDSVFQYVRRFQNEFQVLFAKDMTVTIPDLCESQAFISWSADKGNII